MSRGCARKVIRIFMRSRRLRRLAHSRAEERKEAAPATVLVFRDEHKQEVQNYAIVGQMLWDFDPQHTQKIPLSDLDIPATTRRTTSVAWISSLPVAREGQ